MSRPCAKSDEQTFTDQVQRSLPRPAGRTKGLAWFIERFEQIMWPKRLVASVPATGADPIKTP